MEDTKAQPNPEENLLQPLHVIRCADGWIAVFKQSIHAVRGISFGNRRRKSLESSSSLPRFRGEGVRFQPDHRPAAFFLSEPISIFFLA